MILLSLYWLLKLLNVFFFNWVEDLPVSERLLTVWNDITKPVKYWEALPKDQTDKPVVPYLYPDIVRIIRRLMQLIVKPEILDKCSTLLDYKEVDLDNKNTMVKPKNMNIRFGARSLLTELDRKDKVKSSDLAEFFTNAVLFIVTIIKTLLLPML